jgi:hypothetical protein
MNYFNKIPTITYNGVPAKNLLARAKFSDRVKRERTLFLPYTMKETDRPDLLSYDYYDDSGYEWLVHFSNNVIDPYYDMAITEDDLYGHILSKYGSIEKAARGVAFYRNNWSDYAEERLSPSQYETLPGNYKKYYVPVLNNDYAVHSYRRKQFDDTRSTNRIVTMSITNITGTFILGEEIQVNGTNYGFCTNNGTTQISVQHVTGSFAIGNIITGVDSGVTATVYAVAAPVYNIPLDETMFWTGVSFFDYEQELNEIKKEISLIDASYKKQVESEIKRLMNT